MHSEAHVRTTSERKIRFWFSEDIEVIRVRPTLGVSIPRTETEFHQRARRHRKSAKNHVPSDEPEEAYREVRLPPHGLINCFPEQVPILAYCFKCFLFAE